MLTFTRGSRYIYGDLLHCSSNLYKNVQKKKNHQKIDDSRNNFNKINKSLID